MLAIGLAASLGVMTAPAVAAPPGRAYEMVSPLDKNGGDIDRDLLSVQPTIRSQSGAAPSGDAVAFLSRAMFAGIESGAFLPNYAARRAADGWVTEGISPPGGNVGSAGAEIVGVGGLSLDLSKAFVTTPVELTGDAATLNGSWGLYMRSSGQAERYRLLSVRQANLDPDNPDTTPNVASERFEYEAATPDSSHVLFNSSRRLLEEGPLDSTHATNGPNALYAWVDGSVRLVSVPPPGLSFGTQQIVAAGRGGSRQGQSGGTLHGDHVISDDGRRVFFTAQLLRADGTDSGLRLMVRENGATTTVLSASERAGDEPLVGFSNPNTRFWAAKSTDGSVAFFTSNLPFTEGAGPESLYRWDANADPEGHHLTELSQDDPAVGQPGVLGPAAVTDDAATVYFVARGVLAEGGPRGAPTRGEPNLYLWRQGQGVRFIETLDNSRDDRMWALGWGQGGRAARVSADGERLLFASFAQLDPSYDTTEATPEACGSVTVGGETCRQIYLYDVGSDEITCLTCVAGVPLTGNANLFGNSEGSRPGDPTIRAPVRLPRNLSADGRRAFFETARGLVPEDDNNRLDVYEWRDDDLDGEGELHLVSTGQSTRDSQFVDASLTGSDVFFTTYDSLVGIDRDTRSDLYDARVGGGIPAQNPPPPDPPCQGEACQGAPSGPPLLAGVGGAFQTGGNVSLGPRPSFSVARLSSRQRRRLARGRRIALRVKVNRAGRVSLTARARLGKRKRARTVARASRTARDGGVVRLRLRLSRAARRELARERRLRVRLAVKFAGVREARVSRLSLRRPSRSGRRGAR